VGDEPYYFDCLFSEELDDYSDRFCLWPVPEDELADELQAWRLWTAWRDEYDSGLWPPPFPGDPAPAALERVRHPPPLPASARCAHGDPQVAP